jgi:hypothetical protein
MFPTIYVYNIFNSVKLSQDGHTWNAETMYLNFTKMIKVALFKGTVQRGGSG